jgi:hypothetical protein
LDWPLLALGLLFLWSFSHAFHVLRQAEQLSRGSPYCIGVFDRGSSRDSSGEYRAAGLYDLSALQMRMDPVSTFGGNGSHLPGATALLEVPRPRRRALLVLGRERTWAAGRLLAKGKAASRLVRSRESRRWQWLAVPWRPNHPYNFARSGPHPRGVGADRAFIPCKQGSGEVKDRPDGGRGAARAQARFLEFAGPGR